jgi:Peptidase family M28
MRLTPLIALLLAGCAPQLPVATAAASQTASSDSQLFDDVRILSADDMEGRLAGSPGGAKARAYLIGRLQQIGVFPLPGKGLEWPFSFEVNGQKLAGTNLIGMIPGTGGSHQALLVMAHYDHLGVRDGQIYNGADDNASGVATVLDLATGLIKQAPKHDVVLALVDAEEEGLSGAGAMVGDPEFKEILERVVLAVNLDMVSRSDRNELYATGSYHFPWLKPRLEAIAGEAPVILKLGHDRPEQGDDDWTNQSDHYAFQKIHRPWVYFGVEDHPDYHQPTDDFGAIQLDFFRRSMTTIETAVRAFDRDLAAIAQEANP